MFAFRGSNRRSNYGVWLLAYQLITANEQIPPITLGAIVLQIAIYLGFIPAISLDHTCMFRVLIKV
jgi:hypothetical protein